MIRSIAHICIVARDLAKTERFYCSCLGLKKKFNFVRGNETVGYYLAVNDHNFIEVFKADDVSETEAQPIKHLCLEVDDIDEAAARIKDCGVSVTDKQMGADHSWQVWITDPNGVKIELHQYTDESCQILGIDCVLK